MSPVPPPQLSPKVPRDDPFEQFDAEHPGKPDPRSTTGIYQQLGATTFNTKLQWGAIGTVVVAFGVLFSHTMDKADLVSTAQAQTQATADAAKKTGETNTARIEAVDAGTRMEIIRLEKKIDDNAEQTHRELAEILREVKKR